MHKFGIILLCCSFLSVTACASENDSNSQSKAGTSTSHTNVRDNEPPKPSLPRGKLNTLPLEKSWRELSYKDWITQLSITNCPVKFDGNEQRFKLFVKASKDIEILLITCDLGAYQDAYYTFKIDLLNKTIQPLSFKLPSNDDMTQLKAKSLIWGVLYPSDSGDKLEWLNLSAGSGMCGYLAKFPIKSIIENNSTISPTKIFGDNNCYNGISVEQWPEIEFH